MIRIAPNGDVELRVIEMESVTDSDDRVTQIVKQECDFLCLKEKLVDSSTYFKSMFFKGSLPSALNLERGVFAETGQRTVRLEDTHVKSMEIWLNAIHKPNYQGTLDVPLSTMWHLVKEGDKYDLDNGLLKPWFMEWVSKYTCRFSFEMCPMLLYPCWIFDHAKEFARVTKALAYQTTGHVNEGNPTRLYNIPLPSRVIASINAARGHLRIILHKWLYRANSRLLASTCGFKEKLLFGWELALSKTGAWPLEQKHTQHSINKVVELLRTFKYEPQSHQCRCCPRNFKEIVDEAIQTTMSNFDGLCLDCMDIAHPKTGNLSIGYQKCSQVRAYDSGCRVGHGESTCYYSFLSRKELMDRFKEANKRT